MATPVIAPTIVRIALNHNLGNGHHSTNIIDLNVDEGPTASRPDVVANAALAVGQHWQEDICVLMSNTLTYTGGTYTDLDSLTSTSGSFGPVPGKPVNSGAASAISPVNVAMLVTKHCHHTRTQRPGRMYIAGVIENQVDDHGIISSGQLAGWQTALNLFQTHMNSLGISGATTAWRVVHVTGHTGSPVPGFPHGRPNAWDSTDITNVTAESLVATQRRRNRS